MKNYYFEPEMQVAYFDTEDVVTTSSTPEETFKNGMAAETGIDAANIQVVSTMDFAF